MTTRFSAFLSWAAATAIVTPLGSADAARSRARGRRVARGAAVDSLTGVPSPAGGAAFSEGRALRVDRRRTGVVFAMQVVYRSVQMIGCDVSRHRGWHEVVDRTLLGETRTDRGRRDVSRVRLDAQDGGRPGRRRVRAIARSGRGRA